MYKGVPTEAGVGSVHLGKVILRSGTNGVDIWGGDLGAVGSNGKET